MQTREWIESQQIELRRKVDERNRLVSKLATVESQLEEHENKVMELERSFNKEQLDLHRMDQFSLVNMYRKWKGTHDELREKEYEEAAKAELKLNEHVQMVEDLRKDEQEMRAKLSDYDGIDNEWDAFLAEKKNYLQLHASGVASELETHLTQFSELERLLVEMDEAIEAGRLANVALSRALEKLRSAKSMSTWDTFFGGGMIVTAMKHGNLNESEDALHHAQLHLRRFETELADVNEFGSGGLAVDRGSFLTFADYFFDDIFSEWTIHSRINSSMDNVEGTLNQVVNITNSLKTRRSEVEARKQEVWERYERAIEEN